MQAQYRAYAQPQIPQRSPHATTQRRGGIGERIAQCYVGFRANLFHLFAGPMMPGGSHAAVPMSQAQMAQQQQAQAHASEMAKRRSRKPTDKTLPDGAEETIIDPEIAQRYGELRSVEKQLDSTMTRKRLDVVDAAQRPSKVCLLPFRRRTSVRLVPERTRVAKTRCRSGRLYACGSPIR